MNRANWDLRLDAPPALTHSFEINANPGQTPPTPEGIVAPPGMYTIALTVSGKTYTQKVAVTNDPAIARDELPRSALQYSLLRSINNAAKMAYYGYQQVETMRAALKARTQSDSTPDITKAIAAFRAKVDTVGGNGGGGRRPPPNFNALSTELIGQLTAQDNADQAPTEAMHAAYTSACERLHELPPRGGPHSTERS